MMKSKTIRLVIILISVLLLGSQLAQALPASGLYQIISGSYSVCCGITGHPVLSSLPNQNQSFVRLVIDPQTSIATMTFLADDGLTVFSTVPCLPSGAIDFSFNFGFASGDAIFFHVDPGPPPYQEYWNYTASNSASGLRIDGLIGTVQSGCADAPTKFSHSNVVALLVPGPKLTVTGYSNERGAQLLVQGQPGSTNVIEASTDFMAWTAVSTNVMDYSLCPSCPFIIFEDPASTNLAFRYYRAAEFP